MTHFLNNLHQESSKVKRLESYREATGKPQERHKKATGKPQGGHREAKIENSYLCLIDNVLS